MTLPDGVKSDEQFRADFEAGRMWETRVCRVLNERGIPARLTPKTYRRTYRDRGAHRDAGDIVLGDGRVLDVKSKRVRFTRDPDSWPAGEELWLGQPHHWDAADPRPLAFVLVSQLTGAMLVVPGYTARSWTRAERSWRPGTRQPTLIAPTSTLIPFDRLVRHLLRSVPAAPPAGRGPSATSGSARA